MNKIKTFLVILLSLIITETMYSQQKMKLAVLDPVVAGEKLADGLRISVREIVSSTFVNNADNYSIVERSLLDKVMQEAKFSNSDAVDESQATQLGKLAGADRVVLTVISRFESRCMLSIKLINVETATIDKQISKMVDYNSVLDVTEPLTLAILDKGDANITVASTSVNTPIKGNAPIKANSQPTTLSSSGFNGSGITYSSIGAAVGPQPDELSSSNMNKLWNVDNINVIIDFSEASVADTSFREFCERNIDAKTIEKFPSEMDRLLEGLSGLKGYRFSYTPSAPITLLVKVREIDSEGRENTSDFVLIDTNTKDVISGVRIESTGGRFGSFPNLMGDAFKEEAGPKFIKQLKSAIKKSKK